MSLLVKQETKSGSSLVWVFFWGVSARVCQPWLTQSISDWNEVSIGKQFHTYISKLLHKLYRQKLTCWNTKFRITEKHLYTTIICLNEANFEKQNTSTAHVTNAKKQW